MSRSLRAVTLQGPAIIDREYADYRAIAPIFGLDLDTEHPTRGASGSKATGTPS